MNEPSDEQSQQARGRGRSNGIAKKIWLHIAKEGGRFTAKQVAEMIQEPYHEVHRAMQHLAGRAHSLSRIRIGRSSKFGVTEQCGLPDGVTVGDLLASGFQMRNESEEG